MIRPLLAVAALLVLPGCFRIQYVTREQPAPSATDESWHHGLAWGIAEISDPVDLPHICPDGYARVDSRTTFLNGFVQAFTASIYSPQTVTVTCRPGPDGQTPQSAKRPWK